MLVLLVFAGRVEMWVAEEGREQKTLVRCECFAEINSTR